MERFKRKIVRCLCLMLCLICASSSVHAESCDHTYVEKEEAATCTNSGVRYYECSKCGEQYGHESTDPLGHDFGSWQITQEAGCEQNGQEQRECARCGYTETREMDATGHSYSASVVKPDCESQGYTRYTCSVCGDSYKTDYTDALGHSYESEVIAPTCTKDGYTLNTCSVCGDTEKTDYVDALGHSYGSEVIAPTCTKNGYTLHTCAVCGDTEKSDTTEKTGHHYDDGVVTKEATTTAMGRITYTCYGCGDTYTETTPKIVNPFEDVKKSAYYFDAVIWAVEQGITSGTDETHFSPDSPCTRAQVVTFLWRAMGSPEPERTDCPFVDVPAGSYYRKAVLWAAEQGITSGIDATHFGPNSLCTRAQVVTFLYRAKGSPELDAVERFADVKTTDYFFISVCWASDNGITSGVDGGRFGPGQTCTRAQIVTFLYKADSIQ